MKLLLLLLLLLGSAPVVLRAQAAATIPAPDDRYKADILLVVGHPDDDSEVGSYLARVIEVEHRRVAVVFTTRGNSGGNALGLEQGRALGDVREIEARRALAVLGIANFWTLHGSDTPGADVLHSLEAWGHGATLDEIVRIVRLTRPEVILTWLPDYVVGENHDDHQGAGVLATEAFDLAADRLAFPEQLEAPRNRLDINNYGEGLRPWQPKKIYFFSDATNLDFLRGKGPEYPASGISPARGISWARVAALSWNEYKTQGDFPDPAQLQAYTERPVRLLLGKSTVPASITGGVFEGIGPEPVPYQRSRGYKPPADAVALELGGPWAFYQAFWPAHGLDQLATLFAPQAQINPGKPLWVPLVLRNDSNQPHQFSLRAILPEGWTANPDLKSIAVPAHDSYPLQLTLTPPRGPGANGTWPVNTWQDLRWEATADGASAGSVSLHVTFEANGLPQ
jgi:LmbE family N-acetylglucosaminyl deacetylase